MKEQKNAPEMTVKKCFQHLRARSSCDCTVNAASVELDRGSEGGAERAEALYREALSVASRGGYEEDVTAFAFFHLDAAQNLASLLQSRAAVSASVGERYALLRECAELYRDVVVRDEERWDAWANLGAALEETRAPALDVLKCYQRGIVSAERYEKTAFEQSTDAALAGNVRRALSQLYFGLGSQLAALDAQDCRAAYDDDDVLLAARDDDDDSSEESDEESDESAAAAVRESAANALRCACELAGSEEEEDLDENNVGELAAHALAALSSRESSSQSAASARCSPGYVRALFDDFAPTFDERLVTDLEYAVPELLADCARRRVASRGRSYGRALDAGCGTGILLQRAGALSLETGDVLTPTPKVSEESKDRVSKKRISDFPHDVCSISNHVLGPIRRSKTPPTVNPEVDRAREKRPRDDIYFARL